MIILLIHYLFLSIVLDGAWSQWGSWSACSQTCATKLPGPIATRRRSRSCTDPPPTFGGEECRYRTLDVELCNKERPCGEHGFISIYDYYVFIKVYFILCLNPYFFTIAIPCTWGSWVAWGQCSATCGAGTRVRTRLKSVQEAHGGTCSDQPTETETCNDVPSCGKKHLYRN